MIWERKPKRGAEKFVSKFGNRSFVFSYYITDTEYILQVRASKLRFSLVYNPIMTALSANRELDGDASVLSGITTEGIPWHHARSLDLMLDKVRNGNYLIN